MSWLVSTYSIDPEVLGRRRNQLHLRLGSTNKRLYKDKDREHIIGAYGEVAFGDLFGLSIDEGLKPYGDKYDFKTSIGKIDIKTSVKAHYLYVKVNEINKCDIYVLAQFFEWEKKVEFLGWERTIEMAQQPQKVFEGTGNRVFFKDSRLLLSMGQFPLEVKDAS